MITVRTTVVATDGARGCELLDVFRMEAWQHFLVDCLRGVRERKQTRISAPFLLGKLGEAAID